MPPMAFNGIVTKVGVMNKTATVTVSRWVIHKITGKRIERSKKFLVHDENNKLRKEDVVTIRNCRPISAMKRFTVEKILKSPETEHDIQRAARIEGAKSGGVMEAVKQLESQSQTPPGHARSAKAST